MEIIQRNYRSRPLIRQREEMHIPRGERLRIISGKRRIFPLQITLDTQEVALGGVMPKATLDDIYKILAVRMAIKNRTLLQKCPTCDSRGKLIQVHPVQGT